MQKVEIDKNSWTTQYINSLYFSVVTMITIGFGDITPTNSLEKLFSIFVMLISSGMFGI
jgi:hypothetical protein